MGGSQDGAQQGRLDAAVLARMAGLEITSPRGSLLSPPLLSPRGTVTGRSPRTSLDRTVSIAQATGAAGAGAEGQGLIFLLPPAQPLSRPMPAAAASRWQAARIRVQHVQGD